MIVGVICCWPVLASSSKKSLNLCCLADGHAVLSLMQIWGKFHQCILLLLQYFFTVATNIAILVFSTIVCGIATLLVILLSSLIV